MEDEKYEEVTITAAEIKQEQKKVDVPEKEKIAYHNKSLRKIEGAIRGAIQKRSKEVTLYARDLEIHNEETWKINVLFDIEKKFNKKGVYLSFPPKNGNFCVKLD